LTTPSNMAAIVAGVVVLTLVYQAYQARWRITILAFTNYAGDDYKSYVEGLSARLLNELQRLSDLYKVIDDANPTSTQPASGDRTALIGVTASVEDVGNALRGAITTETKVKLWFFEVPVGAVVAAFARFVQGPRLTGSLHREGQRLILIGR